jgi:hypothetical protein
VDALGSSDNTPWGGAIDIFCIDGERSRISSIASQGDRHQRLQERWWALSGFRHRLPGGPPLTSSRKVVGTLGSPSSPPRGPPSMSSRKVVGASGLLTSPPRGSAIDVFKIDGGRSQTSVNTSQGAHHQRLQERLWALLGFRHRLLGGPAINVFKKYGGRSRISVIASQRAHHRRLQERWWVLPGLQHRLSGAPPSTSSR